MATNNLTITVRIFPGGAFAKIGKSGYAIIGRWVDRTIRGKMRHARMTRGKHTQRAKQLGKRGMR